MKNGEIDRRQYLNEIARLLIQPLHSFLYLALGITDKEERDDIVQEVMLRFLKSLKSNNLPDLSGGLSLGWFYKTAKCVKIDEVRKTTTRPAVSLEHAELVSDPASATGHAVEDQRILSMAAKEAFADLAPDVREVAFLYFSQPYTQKAIAEIVELPETTVNYYVGLAKKHLQSKLIEFVSKPIEKE